MAIDVALRHFGSTIAFGAIYQYRPAMEIVDPFCTFDEYQFVSLQSFCFKLPTATPEHEVLTVKEIAVGDCGSVFKTHRYCIC